MASPFLYTRPSENVTANALVTPSAGDSAYPATNGGDLDPSKPMKLSAASGNWVYDWTNPQRVDVVSLIHHNIPAGTGVFWQMNATNSWGAPSLNVAFTIPAYGEDGFCVNPWLDLTGQSGYTTSGYRYGRLLINAGPSSAIAIGEVVCATTKRLAAVNFQGGLVETDTHPLIEHQTAYGVVRAYDLGTRFRRFKTSYKTITDTNLLTLLSLVRDAHGRVKPFLFVPDSSVNDAYFVRLSSPMVDRTRPYAGLNDTDLTFDELSRGLPL